ncbi:hypothetical protein FKM82_000571 [Ascaphus truei]
MVLHKICVFRPYHRTKLRAGLTTRPIWLHRATNILKIHPWAACFLQDPLWPKGWCCSVWDSVHATVLCLPASSCICPV